jgi:predicted signal transduction protein with EAL and GGDEF domain
MRDAFVSRLLLLYTVHISSTLLAVAADHLWLVPAWLCLNTFH